MRASGFHLLVATDGSAPASAALEAARAFPWPRDHVTALIVGDRAEPQSRDRHFIKTTERRLSRRWRRSGVVWRTGAAATAILREAGEVEADAIALGWRGHGPVRRVLMGSTSRAVLRRATVPVLVARRLPRLAHRIVVGLDDSAEAARALELLCRCRPNHRWTAVVISAVAPMYMPRHRLLSASLVARVQAEVNARNDAAIREAAIRLEQATSQLRAQGWRVRPVLAKGHASEQLLRAAAEHQADIVVLGAGRRAAKGRLGPVTQAALARCNVPVLIVR